MWTLMALFLLGDTPADTIAAAHADLSRLPADARHLFRYLSLYNIAGEARGDAITVLSGHMNSLSRAATIERPVLVAGGLLRVNLEDYGWSKDVWERLTDPYYTVPLVVKTPWRGGVWPGDGKYYEPGFFTEAKKVAALAPWLAEGEHKAKLAEIAGWTGSKAPVVRADWFLNATAIQAERGVGYYDFLGVKDEASFHKLIGFDRKLSEGFRFELREAVAISGVTLHPRAITRHDTLGGGLWRSLDFKVAKDSENPLRILGRDIEKGYDASEQFGHLPNGMWAVGIFDIKGKRVDFAPPDIASDSVSKSNDKRVHVGASCFRCHANAGLQDIEGWARQVLLSPPLELRTADYKKAKELREQYLRRLEPYIARDRATYAGALKEATGLEPKDYAAKFAAFWESYEDRKVTLAIAAVDVGMAEADLKERLVAYLKLSGNLDPMLAALVVGRPIPIRQYEETFPILQTVIRGVK